MTVVDVMALPVDAAPEAWSGGPDRYNYSRLPEELRNQAMLAQGTVVEGLSSAVRRVLDAGQALAWAKSELPHGEYLPWVQQACGLKPQHASQLIKAANWAANVGHVQHLDKVTDTKILFILSADPNEELREWFMQRCAAGDPPSRKEVQERKRSASQPRAPQPAETLALNLLRKGEIDRMREALALAERAQVVTADQVMEEQRLRELGKVKYIAGADADFHWMKDGRWIRLPHAGRVDAISMPSPPQQQPEPQLFTGDQVETLSVAAAAIRLGMTAQSLRNRITPSATARLGPFKKHGYVITKAGHGLVTLHPIA